MTRTLPELINSIAFNTAAVSMYLELGHLGACKDSLEKLKDDVEELYEFRE